MTPIKFGRHSYCIRYNNDFSTEVTTGNFVSIADGFRILVGPQCQHPPAIWKDAVVNHPLVGTGYHDPRLQPFGKLTIGHDVWIGTNVTIVSTRDIVIGNGAIIGACSVITKDVMPYDIVAGNPSRVVRNRFHWQQRELIEKSEWWNWSDDEIKQKIDWLKDVTTLTDMLGKHDDHPTIKE